jgi:long-chain acyl-CoA synthetase
MTIYDLFQETVQKYPERVALMYKKQGEYTNITYQQLSNLVDMVAFELQRIGIKKGDAIAIYSYNRPEWVIVDLATLKLGGVVVPIYHVLPAFYVKYIVNDAKVKMLFVENEKLLAIANSVKNEMPSLNKIFVFDNAGIIDGKFGKVGHFPSNNISEDDIATIVYTSGTTGGPKGVILTHYNIISNTLSAIDRFNINCNDVVVSYLPLSHMFERTGGYYVIMFSGGAIAYAENFTTVVEDVAKIRPTILIALPRVLEKAYQTAEEKVKKSSFIKKKMVYSAIKNLNRYANLKYKNKKIPLLLKIKCDIYRKLVAEKFLKIAGGRNRVIVSGGAPLNKQIAKVYYVLGFNICEGYGLTETSPIVTASTVEDNILGTVGKPFPDVQVKIGDNDEILVKGPNVMLGYHNKLEETAKVIDHNGWFHTGDQGKFDEKSNLVITGRIKELIVTSYGKKIAPIPIEEKLCQCGYIDQVMLFGDKKNYLVALIVPKKQTIEYYAKCNNIPSQDYPELLQRNKIKSLIEAEIEKASQDLAHYEKIKQFVLLSEGFTIENGMLTPTLKLRRSKVVERYGTVIEAMYKNI